MSAIEPGTHFAGRYRLEDRVSEAGGSTLWKATDETLARPVAIRTFVPGFPRVREVVTAARAASRLSDPRLSQVFDAVANDEGSYVVSEWVTGETLADLLAGGPLEPDRAAALVAEAAEALTTAHQAGLAHLCLTPACVVWTPGGTVKVLGLEVVAAVGAVTSDDPARDDARGLGRLLYATLTGHWPGPEEAGLPAAPTVDGRLASPRQVRAGVPGHLDAVTCRALLQEPRRGQPPLTSPAEIAEALADVPRPMPLPLPALPTVMSAPPRPPPRQPTSPQSVVPEPAPTGSGTRLVGRSALATVVVLVLVAIGVGAWNVGRTLDWSQPNPDRTGRGGDETVLKPVSATGFDPLGRDGEEYNSRARYAIDTDTDTAWQTETYRSRPNLGGLKEGVGLLLDMGKRVRLQRVTITLGPQTGTSVELRAGDVRDLSRLRVIDRKTGAGGTVAFPVAKPTEARYVVLWFTQLPPRADGRGFQAQVFEVLVHGAAATSS